MRIYNKYGFELMRVKKEEMDSWRQDILGIPFAYAIENNEIFLYPEESRIEG